VAFTRAEQGLIITAPHPEIRGVKASVAGLLFNSITGNDTLRKTWDETEAVWKSGEWKLSPSTRKETTDSLSLRTYASSAWRDKLVIRQSGAAFFEEETTDLRDRINYGIHMHAVLSRMKFSDEIETTLETIVFEGLITEQDRPSLRTELNGLLNIPEVASWFNRSWTVYTEVPILIPGGNESRLDRLIVDGKKAIVIDFKTGEQKKNDNEQVMAYMNILRQMNFIDVRGFLLYLRQKEVVEVKVGGKQKAMPKLKDKDQMSLGF
jgi:hypothetical protein